jgi:hypothetical protein
VCLNRGRLVPSVADAGPPPGYRVCADHVELVNTPGFDAMSLRRASRAF